MADELTSLFHDFDRGAISRRRLLQVLGLAAVAGPVSAFAQGRCGGARAGTPGCDVTPAKAPFDPTGWKTVTMDHFTLHAADYKREAAYYAMLMGWTIRSDDGARAVLDIGDDVGTVILRGGYSPPPPPPRPAGADTAAGRGRGGAGGNRPPVRAVWDSFAFGIEPFDAKQVEAALRQRGISFTADSLDGTPAYHVKDPDGFDVVITDGRRKGRRGTGSAPLPAPAPFESTGWKTVWLDHISFAVSNYKESTAFYQALLGWHPTGDEGSQNECEMGDVGNIIIRGGGGAGRGGDGRGGTEAPARHAVMNHISFGIQPWDADAVKSALEARGLNARMDTGGPLDIHDPAAKYKSYHTTTPDGWDLQISNATRASRLIR